MENKPLETRVINLKDHMHNLNGSMSGFVVPSGVHINSEPKTFWINTK